MHMQLSAHRDDAVNMTPTGEYQQSNEGEENDFKDICTLRAEALTYHRLGKKVSS